MGAWLSVSCIRSFLSNGVTGLPDDIKSFQYLEYKGWTPRSRICTMAIGHDALLGLHVQGESAGLALIGGPPPRDIVDGPRGEREVLTDQEANQPRHFLRPSKATHGDA